MCISGLSCSLDMTHRSTLCRGASTTARWCHRSRRSCTPAQPTGGCASWRTRRAQAPTSLPASSPALCSHSCVSQQVRPHTLLITLLNHCKVLAACLQAIEPGPLVSHAEQGCSVKLSAKVSLVLASVLKMSRSACLQLSHNSFYMCTTRIASPMHLLARTYVVRLDDARTLALPGFPESGVNVQVGRHCMQEQRAGASGATSCRSQGSSRSTGASARQCCGCAWGRMTPCSSPRQRMAASSCWRPRSGTSQRCPKGKQQCQCYLEHLPCTREY